jgi:hypothetical protein
MLDEGLAGLMYHVGVLIVAGQNQTNARLDKLESRMDRLEERLDRMELANERQFARLDAKLERLIGLIQQSELN